MKNKKLLITILMFSILLTFIIPINAFADTTITNLTGYTVTLQSGWSCDTGVAELSVNYTIDGVLYTSLGVGYNYNSDDLFRPVRNVIACVRDDGSYVVFDPSASITLDFIGGDDVSNPSLIQWLIDKNATIEKAGGEDTPETDSSPSVPMVDYGEYSLPSIDSVWTDKDTYKVAIIFADKPSQVEGGGPVAINFHLVIGTAFYKDYVFNETSLTGNPEAYCSISNWQWYDSYIPYEEWEYNTSGTNNVICRTADYDLIWSSAPIYTDSTRQEYFFQITPPTEVTIAGIITAPILTEVMTEVVEILPMIILLLVGYLALRKALAILVQLLRKA